MNLELFILRIAVVIVVGIMIGVERQLTGHNVGIKTTMLIALGTFAFVMAEILFGNKDMRMSANVITGIGFLCGSVIFKNGLTVNGLNTSATLWGTAGISVLISYGFIWQGVVAAVFLIALNLVLTKVSSLIKPLPGMFEDTESTYSINVVCLKSDVQNIKQIILDNLVDDINLVELQVNTITNDKSRVKAKLEATRKQLREVEQITNKILESDVLSASWEKSSD